MSLLNQQAFRSVQRLPFCYLCGKPFVDGDLKNRDHVPPENIFRGPDREPLLLPTHVACNSAYHLTDEKIGQLIALRYGKVQQDPHKRRLRFAFGARSGHTAVVNLNIDDAVWRWIAGFHSALYQEPAIGIRGSLVTPFPRARHVDGTFILEPLRVQHPHFVGTIKSNRARGNLDRIRSNNGKMIYECVWVQADNNGPWLCIFALDIYDWKDLGSTGLMPARGCAGHYMLPSGTVPTSAIRAVRSSILMPNFDRLDPFSA